VIVNPPVLALIGGSLAATALVGGAAWIGVEVLRRWDLSSGAEGQLALERRTFLGSTLVAYALAFEVVSLFLFVFTADAIAPQLTGAMCAAGSLQASPAGYPVLLLKLAIALLAGLWLVLNHADAQAPDTPLVRVRFAALLGLWPLVLAEAVLQLRYFLDLSPAVITSCCGSLFGGGARGATQRALLDVSPRGAGVAFAITLALALGATARVRRTGRGALLAGALSAVGLGVSLAAVIVVVSPYVYELPTHHCPFCVLKGEYGHVGYALYTLLLGGAGAGIGVGLLQPFAARPSLAAVVPRLQRRLASSTLVLLGAFAAVSAWLVAASNLRAS
jgi:hypothetical protein